MADQQQPRPCPRCHGAKGHVETTTGTGGAQIHVWVACPGCGGTGLAR